MNDINYSLMFNVRPFAKKTSCILLSCLFTSSTFIWMFPLNEGFFTVIWLFMGWQYAAVKSALNSKLPMSAFPLIHLSTCLVIIFFSDLSYLSIKLLPHFEVLLHAGGISIGLINSVCRSFWMYDGKPLSETGWLSWVVLKVRSWEFSICCWDVNENWWNCLISGTWWSMEISKKLSFDIISFII